MEKSTNQKEHDNFKKICLVSSTAFSAATCVWPWAAPIGALLGLVASVSQEHRPDIEAEFNRAINAALLKTRQELTSENSIEILDKLSEAISRPDNLEELIKITGECREDCTNRDIKPIIDSFDVHFRAEVSKCEILSHYYTLVAGAVTFESIKRVMDALDKQSERLSLIEKGVNNNNSILRRALALLSMVSRECGFALIAVAGCLLFALHIGIHAPLFFIQIMFCYLFSSLLSSVFISFWKKYINIRERDVMKKGLNRPRSMLFQEKLVGYYCYLVVFVLFSVAIYSLAFSTQLLEQIAESTELSRQLICITSGCLISWIVRIFSCFNPNDTR